MALKSYKPTTPSRRQMTSPSFEEITKTKPEKKLSKRLKKHAGRNNTGRITCRHRGGGTTRKYRIIDFKQTEKMNIPATIAAIEYDPNRTAYIMLAVYKDGDKRYHIAPEKIEVGDQIITADKTKIKAGNRLMIKNVPLGYEVHNIELKLHKGGQAVRTAGSSAKITSLDGEYAQIEMPSKEIRLIPKECFATIGRISNIEHNQVVVGKAGRTRNRGRRPQVRGKVMNPNDHPHGGGEGSSPIGMKYPKTPWGKHALGVKTRRKKKNNRMRVRDRKGKLIVKNK
jgi:large subunit ribosomal protein L2